MRSPLFAVAWPLLVLLALGDTQARGVAPQTALQDVKVLRTDGTIELEMTGHGPLVPRILTLDSPPRVVVTLPGTEMSTSYNRIEVDSNNVKAVRIGTDRQKPPTTSVVVDCVKACR